MLLITCPFGLASLLTTELKRMKMKPFNSFPTGCRYDTKDREKIMQINLTSRIANKVFLQLASGVVTEFDDLFALVKDIPWSDYLRDGTPFKIRVLTKGSKLHSGPTLQSVAHKAVIVSLTGSEDAHRENDGNEPIEIFIHIEQNKADIFLNTSGKSLHARNRRQEQGEAPIKENLAVATTLLAGRPFHQPLRDPCCGSGTMIIEAARLVRNLPAGELRRFDFQRLKTYDSELFTTLKEQSLAKTFSKDRLLIGTDTNPEIITIARQNAKHAGVDDIVQFEVHDLLSTSLPKHLSGKEGVTVISNPPYDNRLQGDDIDALHHRLKALIEQPDRNGAIISGFEHALDHFPLTSWKRKETRNGKDVCYIWTTKG